MCLLNCSLFDMKVCLFTGDLPTSFEEVKTLANDYLTDVVGQNMKYFIGKNGRSFCL